MRIIEQRSNYTVVEVVSGLSVLYSYKTAVAAHVSGRGFVRTDRFFSRTTSKHINQFLGRAQAEVVAHEDFERLMRGDLDG